MIENNDFIRDWVEHEISYKAEYKTTPSFTLRDLQKKLRTFRKCDIALIVSDRQI
jgi:hypothetical protein